MGKHTDKKYGLLTIKEKIVKDIYGAKCDCGKETNAYMSNIRKALERGNIPSCGCLRGQNISKNLTGKPGWRKIHFTDEQVDRMVELFNQKINLVRIGKEFGVSGPTIKKQLELRGCEVKQRRYVLNDEYFDNIDTEEKAYWLGFLGADGCIRRRELNKFGKTQGDSISLKLSVQDEDHLIKFKNQISPDSKIRHYTSQTITKKGTPSMSHICQVIIHGNRLVEGIMKQGILPRKTFTINRPPIEEKYYRHFIRGFFDGDGCAYLSHRENGSPKLLYSIACASTKLKDFFKEELKKLDIEYREDGLSIFIKKHTNQYKFYHFMYDDSTIYLKRKKDKADEFINFFNKMSERVDSFPGKHSYDINYHKIDRNWTDDEINILRDTNNKIPFKYLSGTLLPNKSISQIGRMRIKLGIVSDKRKMNGYLQIRKELKGF